MSGDVIIALAGLGPKLGEGDKLLLPESLVLTFILISF